MPTMTYSQPVSETIPASATLEEIVVTARKIEENVQDIPMSVQVLSADFLDDEDLTRLYELQFTVPGLVVSNIGMFGAAFSLRGVADQGGTSQSVATHLNGVYQGNSNLAATRMFDLERIEVLKGPQGTLYGRNANGGSINLIARAPEDELSVGVEASYGSFETGQISGYINVPSDQVDFRLAFIGSNGDGYIRNSVDDRKFAEEDFWGLRISLHTDLTESFRLDLTAQHVRDDGARGDLWTPNPAFLPDPADIRLTTVTLANPFLESENDNVSVNIEYDLKSASLHSVSGYARSEVQGLDDCAGLPQLQGCVRGVRPDQYEQWSQEFRLASLAGASFDWLVGAYFFDADATTSFHLTLPTVNPQPINNSFSAEAETAYGAFGQITLRLSDQWSITGGLRLNEEERRVSSIGTGIDDHGTLTLAERAHGHTSWRVDLEYAPSDTVLAYAGVSTGFKSGGITTTILPNGDFNSFDDENLVAWEAGFKAQSLNRELTFSWAAFYYDFDDMQIDSVYLFNDKVVNEIENAAKAEVYGVDTAGTWRISDRLTVSGGFVWLPKREIVGFSSSVTGISLSGNELSRSPEWTMTTALDSEHPLRGGGSIAGRVQYSYRSDFFFTIENHPLHAQESFGLLSVTLKLMPASGNWYVFAAGRNLTAEDYFDQVILQSSPGYPDTYEIGFGLNF